MPHSLSDPISDEAENAEGSTVLLCKIILIYGDFYDSMQIKAAADGKCAYVLSRIWITKLTFVCAYLTSLY